MDSFVSISTSISANYIEEDEHTNPYIVKSNTYSIGGPKVRLVGVMSEPVGFVMSKTPVTSFTSN